MLPNRLIVEPWIKAWLQEDIGRGDVTTLGLGSAAMERGEAYWIAKASGVIAGLPIAANVFEVLDQSVEFHALVADGTSVEPGQTIAIFKGPLGSLLTGERVALNVAMRLSGIATTTRQYVDAIANFPAQLVDTRKTTPGLRLLEKYATCVGGAKNHRMGLDDSVMIKDNHIAAAGGIGLAIQQIRAQMPYPLSIEVETENLDQVKEALDHGADIIMLDNMKPELMRRAVNIIRQVGAHIQIEASGNITLETIGLAAATGVDYISSSAPITRSPWLDLSMRIS